jgi:putative Mg2+ transporter-C (MgtC) family protein
MHPDPSLLENAYLWRLLLAALLGTLMGIDRSIAGKHAGMRTYALVSMGSCVFSLVSTLASYQLGAAFPGVNPLQITSSIVVGIGFIGTGLAVFRGNHPVELTTASGLWVVAAIGMACGYGLTDIALATTILGMIIFTIVTRIERWLRINWGVDGY